MSFPAVGTAVPGLSPYQVSFGGLTMGPGTPVEFQKMEGLDMPDVRTGDAARARDHGLYIGYDLMGGRELTLTAEIAATASTTLASALLALATATVPGGVIEQPCFVNLPELGTVAFMARPRRRQMPRDVAFVLGGLGSVSLQFGATDPRLYATPTQNPSVSPPSTTAGFSFPLSFPLSFGGGGYAGALVVTNGGNIEMRPILTVTGPCTNPSITNASAPGSPNLTFDLSMNAGDQLVIDTDLRTATYYTAGSTLGSSRLYTQARGNVWWALQPGANTIQFLTGDPVASGTLAVAYASAYIV